MASTQGMFLFAKLAVQYLYQLSSREVLLESVYPGHFADEIGKMYDKILSQIFDMNTPPQKKKAIARLLSLLVCAKRPLRWYEIQGFFAFDPDDEARPVDHEFRKLRDDPTDLCLSLIEWHPDNSVQLVHPTARDHLIKNKTRLSRHVAEFEITEHILAFLSSPGMDKKLQLEETRTFVRKGYYSFLDYSVAYWAVHLQAVAGDRSEIPSDRFEELTELLDLYIDTRWVKRDAETDFATSATMNEKLKAFEAIDCFPRLVYATVFARKQLSIHGRGLSPRNLWTYLGSPCLSARSRKRCIPILMSGIICERFTGRTISNAIGPTASDSTTVTALRMRETVTSINTTDRSAAGYPTVPWPWWDTALKRRCRNTCSSSMALILGAMSTFPYRQGKPRAPSRKLRVCLNAPDVPRNLHAHSTSGTT